MKLSLKQNNILKAFSQELLEMDTEHEPGELFFCRRVYKISVEKHLYLPTYITIYEYVYIYRYIDYKRRDLREKVRYINTKILKTLSKTVQKFQRFLTKF